MIFWRERTATCHNHRALSYGGQVRERFPWL